MTGGYAFSGFAITFTAVKKVLIAILAFVYLNIATGVVLNLHYCMGKLSSVEYGFDNHDGCDDCGMEMSDCCKSELQIVKLQDSHKSSDFHFQFQPVVPQLPSWTTEPLSVISFHKPVTVLYHSPPDSRENIIIHTQVFRI